jgi:hypothetical protein
MDLINVQLSDRIYDPIPDLTTSYQRIPGFPTQLLNPTLDTYHIKLCLNLLNQFLDVLDDWDRIRFLQVALFSLHGLALLEDARHRHRTNTAHASGLP